LNNVSRLPNGKALTKENKIQKAKQAKRTHFSFVETHGEISNTTRNPIAKENCSA
jgi:hypothetical protein